LARLKPDNNRHPLQAGVITALKENPSGSYAFFGRNRVGKSLFTWCLVRRALLLDRRVCALNLSDLLDDYRRFELERDSDFRPRILPKSLEGNGYIWTVALQEFDKPRPTEFAAEMLFRLMDAISNNQAQLIITSNLDVDSLSEHWGRAHPRFGPSIM